MKKQILCLFLLLAMTVAVIAPAMAAPLFPDVPDQHWARDAVADLSAKGILEGYPDGTFKGDRAASRWEMAMMLQRFMAGMEQAHARFATKADLEAIRALANQYKDELNAIGVRVKNLEEQTSAINKRVTELERIRFYGYVQGSAPFISVNSSFPDMGSPSMPVVDWTNGRLLVSGNGLTTLAKLGTIVRVNKDSFFGMELVGFDARGDDVLNSYWGLTPPVLSNPYTQQGSATPNVQAKNNVPWTKVTLDRFWYRHKPTDTTLTFGAFQNERTDDIILKGQRNPNIHAPEILPFYGLSLKGRMSRHQDNKWDYEVNYSRLPQASFMTTQMWAGTIRYNKIKDSKWDGGIHFMRAYNRRFGDGVKYDPGSVNAPILPAYPVAPGNVAVYWRNRAGAINNPRLGPQNYIVGGLDLNYRINDQWELFGKAAFSSYDPDTTNTTYDATASGSAFFAGVKVKLDKFDGRLTYQHVSEAYDPMILQYPGAGSGIPVFLPYSTYYVNYYQLHDYINYPNNRHGVKLKLGYDFTDRTRAEADFGYLQQVKASTLNQFTTVGTIEPLFPYLQTAGNTTKGSVTDWGIRLSHKFNDKFSGRIGYFNYNQRRNTVAVDDIDLKEDMAYLNLAYKLSPNVDLYGNYYYIDYKGHTGLANQGFRQHIPSITAETKIAKNIRAGLTYRYYNYKNKLVTGRDWTAHSVLFDYKLDF